MPAALSADRRAAARQKRKQLRGFWLHVGLGIGVALLVIAANLLFHPGRLWSLLLLTAWLVVVLMHGLHSFGVLPWLSADWENKMLAKLQKVTTRTARPATSSPSSAPAQLTNQIPEAQIVPPIQSLPPVAPPPAAQAAAPPPVTPQGWAGLEGWSSPPPSSSEAGSSDPWPTSPPQSPPPEADSNDGWPAGWKR